MNSAQHELDSLASLEERINRAVDLVTTLRAERADMESQLNASLAERDSMGQELEELRAERKQVRTRIEKLIGQMDLLKGA